MLGKLKERFAACGLVLHEQKTKIVYSKDGNRHGTFPVQSFDFLGYTFPAEAGEVAEREVRRVVPASGEPERAEGHPAEIRGWRLQRRSDKNLDDLARMFGPYIRGWMDYYSHFYRSALYYTLKLIDYRLTRWARRKFKPFRQRPRAARRWLAGVIDRTPGLFPHWRLAVPERPDAGSRMS